jgi:serine/threonine protein kinase
VWVDERYLLLEELGSGSCGVVFAAHDTKLDRHVAIKLIRSERTGLTFERFLREARSAARVDHPGVVRIYDVGEAAGRPFVVMEKISGASLAELLRAEGTVQARPALEIAVQLCAALAAAHRSGVIHCDLKPANILLERSVLSQGAARIVDFGLACLIDCGAGFNTPGQVFGSLPYMSSEQALGAPGLDPRTDVYAIGCVLYEMLAGRPPFARSTRLELKWAILNDPVPAIVCDDPRLLAPLTELFEGALAKRADLRTPSAEALKLQLEAILAKVDPAPKLLAQTARPSWREPIRRAGASAQAPAQADVRFVGRDSELAQLALAFARSRTSPQVCIISGPSGIGKTALLEHFALEISRAEAPPLVLRSRCHSSATAPFPALDAALEDLSRALAVQPVSELAAVWPRRCAALCQLFPVLLLVPVLAELALRDRLLPDPGELRNRAFAELRELFQRLGDRFALVLCLDDAQWLDPDSGNLLRRLLGGEDPPNMLLVGATREAPSAESPATLAFEQVETAHLQLSGLLPPHALQLVSELWIPNGQPNRAAASQIVEQCDGNPYLLTFAVEHAATTGELSTLTLPDAIMARYARLSGASRAVVEFVVLTRAPLSTGVILRAVGQRAPASLHELSQSGLVRITSNSPAQGLIEPYHAAVVAAVSPLLAPEARLAIHRAIASELRREWPIDEAALVEHTAASGDWKEAARFAAEGAQRARNHLAFERAAALYEISLRHYVGTPSDRRELMISMAEALANAGRTHAAGTTLLAASDGDEPRAFASLRRRAGEWLLSSGDIGAGLSALSEALSRVALELPVDALAGLLRGVSSIQQLAAGGLEYTARAEGACNAIDLERVDLCLSLAQSLNYIDLRFLAFVVEGLALALALGEPKRLLRACALFVAGTASHLPNPLTAPALELCRQLAARDQDPHAQVHLLLAESEVAHFSGNFLAAEIACEQAEHLVLERCIGAARELADVRIRSLLIQYSQKGDYRSIFARSSRWLAEASSRQDRFYANWLRATHALVWVARDDPERARTELNHAQADWPGGGVFEVAVVLYLDVTDRYLGDDTAHLHPAQGRTSVLHSPASQTPFLQGYLHLHCTWGWLRQLARRRAAASDESSPNGIEGSQARRAIDALRNLKLGMWNATADALAANLSFLDGHPRAAIEELESSESAFRQLNMLALAACARKRRGQFMLGEVGRRLEAEADAQLRELGVVAPEKFAAAYFAPFPASAAPACETLDGSEAL